MAIIVEQDHGFAWEVRQRGRHRLLNFIGSFELRVAPFDLKAVRIQSAMPNLYAAPFKCPNCRALYQVIRIEAAPANDGAITCHSCGGPFLPGKGNSPSNTFFCGDPANLTAPSIASYNCH